MHAAHIGRRAHDRAGLRRRDRRRGFHLRLSRGLRLTALSSWLLAGGDWLRLAGALVLLYFALRILRVRPEAVARNKFTGPYWRGFASAYLLTLANPPTILFFAGLFASITALSTVEQAAVFAFGIFTGSMLWWLALTSLIASTAAKLAPNVLAWINRLAAVTLIGFAGYALSGVTLRAT